MIKGQEARKRSMEKREEYYEKICSYLFKKLSFEQEVEKYINEGKSEFFIYSDFPVDCFPFNLCDYRSELEDYIKLTDWANEIIMNGFSISVFVGLYGESHIYVRIKVEW
jgi:hypothetical protein